MYDLNETTGAEYGLNTDGGSFQHSAMATWSHYNGYDNQIYCFGQGQTATTVTAAPAINNAAKVLIKGTVTDQSPGQTA